MTTLSRLRPWIAASLLSVCVALAGGEVAARWLGSEQGYVTSAMWWSAMHGHGPENEFRPHARFIWYGQPSRKQEFAVFVRNNAWGFHDGEHDLPKRPGRPRILVIGDSFVEALQVPLQAGFPRLLAGRLRRRGVPVEIVVVARSGWGPIEYGAAVEEWAEKLDPDLVVCSFYPGNDVRNASASAEGLFAGQRAGPLGDLWNRRESSALPGMLVPWSRLNALVSRLALLHQIRRRYSAWNYPYKIPADFYVFAQGKDPISFVEDGWNRLRVEVGRMAETLARRKCPLLAVSTSDDFRLARGPEELVRALSRDYEGVAQWRWDFNLFEKRLASVLLPLGIPYVDLQNRFAARMRASGQLCHFPSDGHWNETGHAWAAEALEPEVERLLPKRPGVPSSP
ncbi:MAG: hypothetical protein ACHQM4_05245 [Thermoanaerobaculia bacterium]